jgi:threonine 3-dehydrogenase
VKFIYPSSIAAYGLPSLEAKTSAGKVKEADHCNPITMYGCNKLYCEHLGRYYSTHYRQLAADHDKSQRRFPRHSLPRIDQRGYHSHRRHK